MIELVPLEVDFGAAKVFRQPLGIIERTWTPGIIGVEIFELGVKGGIVPRFAVSRLKLEDQRHERLGHKAPAIEAEVTPLVRSGAETIQVQRRFGCKGHASIPYSAAIGTGLAGWKDFAVLINLRMRNGVFTPGAVSTPD